MTGEPQQDKLRPMRLPLRSVKIAGQTIRLKFNKRNAHWAQWFRDDNTIEFGLPLEGLEPARFARQFAATLRHEMLHAALDLSGVSHGMTAKLEEQVVRCCDEIVYPAWDKIADKLRMIEDRNFRD